MNGTVGVFLLLLVIQMNTIVFVCNSIICSLRWKVKPHTRKS